MKYAQVQFAPWDKSYSFSLSGIETAVSDYVIVETELGLELGKVLSILDEKIGGSEERELKPVLRKASYDDIASLPDQTKKDEALEFCREKIEQYKLPMKLVDVHYSLQGGRMNFAFISDGRVDFRDLVKDLAAHYGVNIRLTQIGTRDEAKITGDCGPCGRGLCCRGFLDEFSSITSEMAEAQQVVHRGSERISGMCGRLMCCLSYEYEGYKELAGKLPPLGTRVNVDGTRGVVCGHHILKQTVDVKIPAEKPGERDITIEVDINRHKKKKK
jgi:cell fate regulator YaaT (PSP1 superfamily)